MYLAIVFLPLAGALLAGFFGRMLGARASASITSSFVVRFHFDVLPGFPLQPSELMKVAFVLALAWYLRYRINYRNFTGLLVPLMVAATSWPSSRIAPFAAAKVVRLPATVETVSSSVAEAK